MGSFSAIIILSAVAIISFGHDDLLRFDEYEFKFNRLNQPTKHHRNLIFDDTNDPFHCTDTIPTISKNLCFRWDSNDGFKFGYNTNNILKDIISMNDDSKWNEINYGTNYTKQCRYSSGTQECIHYSSPLNGVTFKLKIGSKREPRENSNNYNILPANIYHVNDDIVNGQDIDQFMFGNDMLNQQYFPVFGNNHNSVHQFGYGDALGFDQWAADMMDWRGFECDFCDDFESMDDTENTDTDKMKFQFSSYGDYTYLFNEHEIEISAEKEECTPIIHGIEHKVCITTDDAIYFRKKSNELSDAVDDELYNKLEEEFDGVVLSLNNDTVWDDITTLHDHNSVRKCKTFQMAKFCVTHGMDGYLTINVQVGTQKLHRIDTDYTDYTDYLNDWMLGDNVPYYEDMIGDDVFNYDEPDEYDNYLYQYLYDYDEPEKDDNDNDNEQDFYHDIDLYHYHDIIVEPDGIIDEPENEDISDPEAVSPESDESVYIMDEMWWISGCVSIGIISMFCLMVCMICVYCRYWTKPKKDNENKEESECDVTEITVATEIQGETLK